MTATLDSGLGAQLRAGPFLTGFHLGGHSVRGMRGGEIGTFKRPDFTDVVLMWAGVQGFHIENHPIAEERGKLFLAGPVFFGPSPMCLPILVFISRRPMPNLNRSNPAQLSAEYRREQRDEYRRRRRQAQREPIHGSEWSDPTQEGKTEDVDEDMPLRRRLWFYSDLEFTFSLVYGFRLGFNPGELLDFLMGWIGLDIYDDDLEKRGVKQNKASPEPYVPYEEAVSPADEPVE